MSVVGRDKFIDFLKGISIIFVVITHNLPSQIKDLSLFPLWGAQAVPVFLLIQVLHGYNKNNKGLSLRENFSLKSIMKVYKRILQPFIILFIIIVAIKSVITFINGDGLSIVQHLIKGFNNGGYGPGSYYIWIYLQFFILIPFCYKLLVSNKNVKLMGGSL